MDFLDDLQGGGQRQDEYRDFADRYDQGAPYERISDDEAMQRYQQMAPELPRDEYEQSAREALSRMEPEERQQFGQQLRDQYQQQGYGLPDQYQAGQGQGYDYSDQYQGGQDERLQDPDHLAGLMGHMHQENPDMMSQLLGGNLGGGGGSGGGGGAMGGHLAKAVMSGIASRAFRRIMGEG